MYPVTNSRLCLKPSKHVRAGLFLMDCVSEIKREWIWYLVGPLLGLAALALMIVWLVLNYRARLLQAWETRHIRALKARSATTN